MTILITNVFQCLHHKINEPRDPAGLGIARFLFGVLMVIDIFEERGLRRLPEKYADIESCYFPLFNDLPRLSVEYMHLVYFLLLVSALLIALGFFYKLSCLCFMVCYWYIFFLDKTVWNNHSYLYGLLSILLFLSNANYYWSVDGLMWPSIRNKSIPAWQYGVLRFQLFLLYFYAGIKKLDRDWMQGHSMTGLSREWIFDPFRMFLSNEDIDFYVVHLCGLMLDLSAGFLLVFDRTRIIGFFFLYQFHGMNAVMFHIGMFSYMCMAMIPIFCRTDWPKVIIRKCPNLVQMVLPLATPPQTNEGDCSDCATCSEENDKTKETETALGASSDTNVGALSDSNARRPGKQKREIKRRRFSLMKFFKYVILVIYVCIQIVLPWSHSITKGYNSWTEGLYGYSWDMMIHSWSTQHVVVKVVDEVNHNKQYIRPGAFCPFGNSKNRIFSHPDMLKQYAACLAERVKEMPDLNITKPQIYFDVWKSMNSRYQQRMIDPHVDIVKAPWSPFEETKWLKPLLVDLSSWRNTLNKIRSINHEVNNATDIVFVADFPGLFLENYIAPEIKANITVLHGQVIVEKIDGIQENITLSTNDTLSLESDATHAIRTVSENPSCYMYAYYNTTWVEQSDEEILASDPELQRRKKQKEEWNNKTIIQKFQTFVTYKLRNMEYGLRNIYFFLSVIFDVGVGENGGVISDEL